ncbi:alanine racemase [Catelliglobosispora koreensis]|uniref:alanine racemase n=1 Tax=Catelliglobosispora koreensis TaxID=129052 RepID=UPI000370499A|nr:alanine racemase [Catelliglobosispora koreensis]
MSLGQAVIDSVAIGANIRHIAAQTRTPLMAVVKANGFGHGAVTVAEAALACGATWLGVTSTAEAMELRSAGITAPMLSWLHRADEEFADLIAANVDIGVSSLAHLHGIAEAAARTGLPAAVQLKVDVGLSRNGILGDDWTELVTYARKHEAEGSVVVRGLWSHLTNADVAGCPSVGQQVTRFHDALQVAHGAGLTPDVVHLANSGAALAAPQTRFDLCRIGLAMYGVDPFWREGVSQRALQPAMTLRTSVVNVKRVPAGTGVSYGPDYVTDRPATLALIPLGYADGLPRAAEGRASVWLAGQRCPIVGRISMDQCVVNAGDLPVSLGDPVIVFGAGTHPGERPPAVEDWAHWARTNPHEILTGIGARVARVTPQEARTR